MSDATDVGKLGLRLAVVTVVMMLTMSVFSIACGQLWFSDDLSFMRSAFEVDDAPQNPSTSKVNNFSVWQTFADMIPQNLVDPMRNGNVMQVMFLAICFGVLINKLGPRPKWVDEGIELLRRLFINAMDLVVMIIPLVVFISMMSLTALTSWESIMQLAKIIVGQAFGVIVVLIISSAMVWLLGGTSPISFIKKSVGFFPVPFAAASSNGALPATMRFVTDNLGISAKLASFVVPVGLQFNKEGNCFFFAMVASMMMRVYGIELSAELLLTFFITLFLMSISKPSIPCAGIICLTYLFTAVGIPGEAVMQVLGIEPILALFIAVCNVTGNTAVSFIVTAKENMVDMEKYNKA